MKKLILAAAITLTLSIPHLCAAVNDSAAIIFPELTSGAGARAESMAGAFTAVADDASAVYWNPAGLSRIDKVKISLAFDKWFMDSFYSDIMTAFPAGPGTVGFDVFYMSYGSFNRVNDSGTVMGAAMNPYSLSVLGGYGMSFGKEFSAGLSAKIAMQSLDTYSYTGFGLDASVLYKSSPFSAGLSLQNLGTAGAYSMPLAVKAGVSLLAVSSRENKLTIAADFDYIMKDAPYASAGAEYVFSKVFFLRAGYRYKFGENTTGSLTGLSAGAGFAFSDFSIDYAYIPYGDIGTTHRVTLNMEFGMPDHDVEMLKPVKRAVDNDSGKAEKTLKELQDMLAQGGKYENSGNLNAAEKQYRAIIDSDFEFADAWKRLGAVMVKKKNNVEAFRCFQQYLKLRPDDRAVKSWLEKNSRE